jgi:site-specific DNA recombinase
MAPRLRAVGYVRVSGKKQVEGASLEAQEAGIRALCRKRDYDFVEVYVEPGRSARSDKIEKRPELRRLLDDAPRGKFDVVVVHSVDRWARNILTQCQALQILGKSDLGFVSCQEEYADFTTPQGRLLLTLMGAFAQYFSEQLGFHVSKVKRFQAEQGRAPGPLPWAYRAPEPGATPVAVPEEARAIHEAFEARAAGASYGEIARRLNAQGFRTRERKNFTAHALKDLLANPFYVGSFRYKGRVLEGNHQPIVSQELFDAVQARRRLPVPRRTSGPAGLLQGIAACGHCGQALQSDRHRFGAPMYRERHANDCPTNGRSAMAHSFDSQIQRIVTSLELPPNWRELIAQGACRVPSGANLDDLREQRRRLAAAYVNLEIPERTYQARLARIDAQILEASGDTAADPAVAANLLANLDQLWKEATEEERRRLLAPLIERAYLDLDSKLIGAIVPTPAFRALLSVAVTRSGSSVYLVSPEEQARGDVWRWWRRGGIEPPQLQTGPVVLPHRVQQHWGAFAVAWAA